MIAAQRFAERHEVVEQRFLLTGLADFDAVSATDGYVDADGAGSAQAVMVVTFEGGVNPGQLQTLIA